MMRLASLALLLALAGCNVLPQPRPPQALYDFGAPAAWNSPAIAGSIAVARVSAPDWLESPTLQFRLAYQAPLRHQGYAGSRWVAAPSLLLTERLRQAAAQASSRGAVREGEGVKADYLLRVDLEEFSQVFDSPESSRGVIRARASLVREGRVLAAQQGFVVERPAVTADAAGGAQALAAAADQLVIEILGWMAQTGK